MPASIERVRESVNAALGFLARAQLDHGEWRTFASPDPALCVNRTFDSSPFCTALILASLAHVERPAIASMVESALGFLRAEMRGPGLWTYWSSRHPRHREAPPDLDDIACATWALRTYGVAFASCESIILDHRNERGLFYTWLVPRPESSAALKQAVRAVWQPSLAQMMDSLALRDITDMGVIANALLFLGTDDPRTHPSRAALIEAIATGREVESGDYYERPTMIWYFVARAHRHGADGLDQTRAPIVDRIAALANGPCSSLELALIAATLLNFAVDEPVAALVERLVEAQAADGSWPGASAYILGDRERGTGLHYGSEELTTGFCVEALAHWLRRR